MERPQIPAIELCYAYDCEQKLVNKGLPSMIENVGSPELRSLEQHLEETRGHIMRLEQVFAALGTSPDTKDNEILDKMMNAAKDSYRISMIRLFAIVPSSSTATLSSTTKSPCTARWPPLQNIRVCATPSGHSNRP